MLNQLRTPTHGLGGAPRREAVTCRPSPFSTGRKLMWLIRRSILAMICASQTRRRVVKEQLPNRVLIVGLSSPDSRRMSAANRPARP